MVPKTAKSQQAGPHNLAIKHTNMSPRRVANFKKSLKKVMRSVGRVGHQVRSLNARSKTLQQEKEQQSSRQRSSPDDPDYYMLDQSSIKNLFTIEEDQPIYY
jgi:hypothetical protein